MAIQHRAINILISQIVLTDGQISPDRFGLHRTSRSEAVYRQVTTSLRLAEKHNCSLVVFPELSLPDTKRMRTTLRNWSERHQAVLVGGSYYKKVSTRGQSIFAAVCPVFVAGSVTEAMKCQYSPFEHSDKVGLKAASSITVIPDTPAGTIAIAICSDAFANTLHRTLDTHNIDILCVPSMQPRPDLHHRTLADLVRHNAAGFYAVYANAIWKPHAQGQSALFGHVDRSLSQSFVQDDITPPSTHDELILEMPECGRNLIVSVDIDQKRPHKAQTVHDKPQIQIAFKDYALHPNGHRYIATSLTGGRPKIRLVAFDVDGTLTAGAKFSWQLLWSFLYHADADRLRCALRDRYYSKVAANPADRIAAYQEWCSACCDAFKAKKLTRAQIVALARTARPVNGLRETLTYLKYTHRCHLVAISGGIDLFAKAALGDEIWHLFDKVYINHVSFSESEGDVISHIEPTIFDFEGKFEAILSESLRVGCSMSEVAFVGDEINDRDALTRLHRNGGTSIAFGPDAAVSGEEATHLVQSERISEILPYIRNVGGVRPQHKRNRRCASVKSKKEPSEADLTSSVERLLSGWVNVIEQERDPICREHVLSCVRHDAGHRKRVWHIVSQILSGVGALPEPPHIIRLIASCAVLTHDIGLFLPLEGYYPNAATYPDSVLCTLRRWRHHNIAGIQLDAMSRGLLHPSLEQEMANYQHSHGIDSYGRLKDILSDTLRLLAYLTSFHDADETELIDTFPNLERLCKECATVPVSPGTMQMIRAAVRCADRIDRSHHRLASRRSAESLCLRISKRNSTYPGVVCDSIAIRDVEILPMTQRVLRLKYHLPTFRSKEAQDAAGWFFENRILGRLGPTAPWYVRLLEKRHGIRIASIDTTQSTSSRARRSFARPLGRTSIAKYHGLGPMSAVLSEVLLACDMGSWIKSTPSPLVLCGGVSSESYFQHHRTIPDVDSVVFDRTEWGGERVSTIDIQKTSAMVDEFLRRGGDISRLKGLMSQEHKSEWDIYITLTAPESAQTRAVLNCHIPRSLGYSAEQVSEYASRVEKEIGPFRRRLDDVFSTQMSKFDEMLNQLDLGERSSSIDSRTRLVAVSLNDVMNEVFSESACQSRQQDLPDQSGYLFVARVFYPRAMVEALRQLQDIQNQLDACSVTWGRHPHLPALRLHVTGSINGGKSEMNEAINLFKELCKSGELFVDDECREILYRNRKSSSLDQAVMRFFNLLRPNGCDARCVTSRNESGGTDVSIDIMMLECHDV